MEAQEDCIRLCKAELEALLEHCSTDATRKHINGVFFRLNGKATAVATDGHRLVRCEVPAGCPAPWEFLAPRESLSTVLRAARAADAIEVRRGECRIGEARFPIEAGNPDAFPPYEQVIPEPSDEPCTGVGCDAKYLGALGIVGKAFKAAGWKHSPVCVRIQPGAGELDPVRFEVGAAGEYPWTVVIMPIRQ